MMRMPGPGGVVVMMGGRMMRILGPPGAVVMMGGRMQECLVWVRWVGREGCGGSGGRCFSG